MRSYEISPKNTVRICVVLFELSKSCPPKKCIIKNKPKKYILIIINKDFSFSGAYTILMQTSYGIALLTLSAFLLFFSFFNTS